MKKIISLVLIFSLILVISLFAEDIIIPDSIQQKIQNIDKAQRFDYLCKASKEWRSRNGDLSLIYAQLAFEESTIQSKAEYKTDALLLLGYAYTYLGEHDTAIYIGSQALSNYKEDDDIIRCKLLLASALNGTAEYHQSIEYSDEVIKYYEKNNDSVSIYEALSIFAISQNFLGDYPSAIHHHQRALLIGEKSHDTIKMIAQYTKIGRLYMDMENYSSAREYYFKAYNLANNFTKNPVYKTLISYLGGYYTRMHIYDSAEMFYRKSMRTTMEIGKKDDIAGAYMNLGNLLCRQGKFEVGKPNFDTALMMFTELKLEQYIAKVYNSYATMYGVRGKYDSSLYYAKKALEISYKNKNAHSIRSNLYRIASAYDKLKDYKSSLKYAKKFIFFNDSLVSVENRAIVAELETKYESAKKEKDILALTAEKETQKSRELILWITFFAIFVILLILVFSIIQKRKKDKVISRQEQLVLKKEKELTESELEKSKLQEQELRNEIQYKSKQLTTHALNMMQKNIFMQELQDELIVLNKTASTENKSAFRRLKMLIKKNLRSDKDWGLFKLYFEDVNKNFYDDLTKMAKDLTPNDLKLCALLKLNMNIKESASVLNIEPASVKTARYKLRKKFALQPEDDLVEFIRKIG